MAVTAACFKWADVLENQFDKSWVELDTILCQLEDDEVKKAKMSNLTKKYFHCFFRTLVCCTCKAGEQPHLLPPASLSLLTSRPQSSRFIFSISLLVALFSFDFVHLHPVQDFHRV